jgi:hypothetical protein
MKPIPLLLLLLLPWSCSVHANDDDDLRNANGWCTKRYLDRSQPGKFQPGFEACEKIVNAWQARQHDWDDISQHKAKIDGIAAKLN